MMLATNQRKPISALLHLSFSLIAILNPVAFTHAVQPVTFVERIIAEPIDLQAVQLEDQQRELEGAPYRFAIPRPTLITANTNGTWEDIDDETLLWRLRISSPGAESLNLGFARYHMPPGGILFIYSADGNQVLGPFTDHDNEDHGQLWTPVVFSDEIVVELTIPAASVPQLDLELTAINQGYRGFGMPDSEKSGWCNIDVVCPEGDLWRDQIRSVAVYSVGGSLICTGVLVNNTAEDCRPYFLTANHCGVNSGNAASMVVYWNYERPDCNSGSGSLSQYQMGAYFRASYTSSDFTLVELDEDPDPSFNVYFAGWSRGNIAPSKAVAIHHPSCDEKSISFENDPLNIAPYLTIEFYGAAPFNGIYPPEGNLDVLKDKSITGTWQLEITDDASGDSGILNSWSLIIRKTGSSSYVEYQSSDVPKTIPDRGTTTSRRVISESGTIADLNVKVNITHSYDADLDVFLIAPDGTEVELFTDVGGSGKNFTNTILDDECEGDATHLRVRDWDAGTTEPGSSGGPIFDSNKRIVGQLHGGYAACDNNSERDWFGRFYKSWTGGGTNSTRLSTWLDPIGIGVLTLDGKNPCSGPDTTPPKVTITSPTSNPTYSTSSSPLSIGGTASDNVGVTKVTWSNDRGGSGTCSGTTSWSASGITLYSGQNVITLTARDAANNTGKDTLTVTYTPPDSTPPEVAITSPTSNPTYSTSSSPLSIGGTASDNIGVTKVTWSNDRGGGSGTCSGTTSWSASGITLYPGQNVITVTARDAANNTGKDTLTVTYMTVPVLHTEPNMTPGLCNMISWDSVPAARAYYAECSSYPSFLIVDYNSGWITRTSYQFCDLATCQKYWYRVKSGSSAWSQTSQAEFQNDTLANTIATIDGDVVLTGGQTATVDTVGGTSYSEAVVSGGYFNGFLATTRTTLTQIEIYLDISTATSIEFVVYEGGALFSNQYNRIHSSTLDSSGTGTKFHSSGPVFIPLEAGTHYMIGAVWSGSVTAYYDEIDSSPTFATHTGFGYCGFPSPDILSELYEYPSITFYHRYTTSQSIGGYDSPGSIVSTPINFPAGGSWDVVDFNTTTPPDTELTVDILPAAGSTPIPGYENVYSGAHLSEILAPSIQLRANLSTNDPNSTPVLHDWSVTYTDPAGIESLWSNVESSYQVTPGDFEPDCDVDFSDFAILGLSWLTESGDAEYNPNCDIAIPADNLVDMRDVAVLAEHWLEGTE